MQVVLKTVDFKLLAQKKIKKKRKVMLKTVDFGLLRSKIK
jgi:hypothetical protein